MSHRNSYGHRWDSLAQYLAVAPSVARSIGPQAMETLGPGGSAGDAPLQGGKVVSVHCAVCCSHSGRVVRRSLLSNCPGALTAGRLLALRDVLLGLLPGSKRAARLDRIPEEVLRASSGPCRTRSISCPFSFVVLQAALLHVLIELALNLRQCRCASAGASMSRAVARVVSPAASASDEFSSDEEVPVQSNVWCPMMEAAYHHSIGAFLAMSVCHGSKAALSQSTSSSRCATCTCSTNVCRRQHACSAGISSWPCRSCRRSTVEFSTARRVFFSGLHIAGELRLTLQVGPVVREVHHLSMNVHRTLNESIPETHGSITWTKE